MPETAKTACGGLVAGAVIWTIVCGIAINAILAGHGDAITIAITAYWACLAVGGYISGILIWQRVSFATVPAAIIAVAYALFFPIGTLIGGIILLKLFDKDTRAYLAQ